MPLGKKVPQEKSPRKINPVNMPPRKIAPRKIVLLDFCCLTVVHFKLFIVTSFTGVSGTTSTSTMDLLVTVVNGIN